MQGWTSMATTLNGIKAKVHCTMCSRVVEDALAIPAAQYGSVRLRAMPGQKCSHCATSLDAARVLELIPLQQVLKWPVQRAQEPRARTRAKRNQALRQA